jgi:type IV pilus assembly protein PilY1
MSIPSRFLKKSLVVWLTYSFGFGPLTPAYAVVPTGVDEPASPNSTTSRDFSDVPLPAKKRPNPNMIFSIDDSGSTDSEVSINGNDGAAWYYTAGLTQGSNKVDSKNEPGFFGLNMDDKKEAGAFNFNKEGNASDTWKKFVYLFPNGQCGAYCDTRSYADARVDHFAISPSQQFGFFRSPDFNKQYYNPTLTYVPWKPYNDGTGTCPSGQLSGSGALQLCTPEKAPADKARSHPIYGSETVDLTKPVPKSTSDNRVFRLYDGMRVLSNADYRRCKYDGGGKRTCENWQTATKIMCVGESSAAETSCEVGGVSFGSSDLISMKDWDHAEMAVEYNAARYFISENSKIVTPADYAKFGEAVGVGLDSGKMYMVDIKSGQTYPKAATRTDCAGTDCTYEEELQNFANWYQYYRKRHLSLSAAIGNAIDGVRALNGGYTLFNRSIPSDRNVKMYNFDVTDDFTQNQRRLLGFMYRTKGDGGTPTREALEDLGQLFTRNKSQKVQDSPPSLTTPTTNVPAPITHKCQFNGGFVITDGFATNGGPTTYGNYDGQTAGTTGPTEKIPTFDAYYFNQTNETKKPAPYQDTFSNTLADIAMKYYTENLRTDLPAGKVPVNFNDTSPDADKNPNLHMNTYGLILGLSGRIFGVDKTKSEDPYNNVPDWAALWSDKKPTDTQRDPRAIDELWHATINGRGVMLKADSPEETRSAVLDVVNNIQNKGGAAAAVSVSNANPVKGDNYSYQSAYNSGSWYGDLNKYEINLTTGEVSADPLWKTSPRALLADRDWTGRFIATWRRDAGKGVPFKYDDLSTDQQNALTGGKGTAKQKVDFLRGDRSLEGDIFRSRGPRKRGDGTWLGGKIPDGVAVLGDIVDAEPVIVAPPKSSYYDAGYADFKTAKKDRQTAILQGANDGMLHAFSATDGAELWAYVPGFAFDKRQDGTSTPPGLNTPGLANLADKEFFIHKFFVDATPVVGDVDFRRAGTPTGTGSPDWRTIAIGGLAKGGRGWYALDVTSTTAASDAQVAAKVLWEFPSDSNSTHLAVKKNVGYSYGRPIITKTKAAGWVVIVPSGYENGDETGGNGRGYLFVLNPKTGDLISSIEVSEALLSGVTGSDLSAAPLGIAHVVGYADNGDVDNTIKTAYAGDLYGNVWRFDLRGENKTDWNVALLSTLKDDSNARQPVTTEPELGAVNSKLVVYVGTGKYFGDRDIPDTTGRYSSAVQSQSIYALMDDLSLTAPEIKNLRSGDLVKQTATKTIVTNPDGTIKSGEAKITPATVGATIDPATPGRAFNSDEIFGLKKGWYLDLPDTGERIVTNPTLGLGALSFTSNTPSGLDQCLPGGSSWVWSVDYRTGTAVPGHNTTVGAYLGATLASRIVMVKLPNGKVQGLIRKSDATTVSTTIPTAPTTLAGKRKSWRELIVE